MNLLKITTFMTGIALMTACNLKKGGSSDLADNPFVHPTKTYLDAPDFSRIKTEHFMPAFEEGMRQQLQEIDSIANNPEAPTFQNTIVALETSGALLTRTNAVFFSLSSADTNDDLIKVETEIAPKLSEHNSKILLNEKLFARIKAVHDGDTSKLNDEDKRLLKIVYDRYVKNGAMLNKEDKKTLAKLNAEEAKLTTDFGNKLTKATSAPLYFTKEELDGLNEDQVKAAAEAAQKENKKGQYLIRLENTTQQPILASLNNRETRQKIYEAAIKRCVKGDDFDTQEIVKKLVTCRAKKAKLLGFNNYAEWKLTDCLAEKPDNVISLLTKLAQMVKPKADKDFERIQNFARTTQGDTFNLRPWDWNYYAEKLKKAEYGVDEKEISQYFIVDSVLVNGVFYAAKKMYGLTFKPRKDITVYHEDVSVWDVIDKDGKAIALYYFDPYSRPSKSGGAWMSNFVEQSKLLGHKPVVYNVCNNPKPAKGKPAFISWNNVTTMFHEFGHGLHGIFADQNYPEISGTNVPRDFVEMPSQFNEHAADDPEVFNHYARHYQTREVMPKTLYEKMKNAQQFNQAYPLVENIASCLLDMAWYMLTPEEAEKITDITSLEAATLKKYGVDYSAIPPRYLTTYFRHIMSNGYSAGYYSYLWTEALCHDIYQTMANQGGLTAANGQRFRDQILSKGNSRNLMDLFAEFTGRKEVDLKPLLHFRGLDK